MDGALLSEPEPPHAPRSVEALKAQLAEAERRLTAQAEALAASEARYRMLFDHSPDLVFTVDFRGVIQSTNRTARKRLEPLEPLVGHPLADIFEPESAREVLKLFEDSISGSLDRRFVLVDGRVVLLRAAPVPDDMPMLQVVLRDVTSRVHMEEELERSRRLVAVGHLAAGVAHEINNPLTVMQLRVDLLREQTHDPEARNQLHVVRDHISRVARIVQNLQTFARPIPKESHSVDVSALFKAALELSSISLRKVEVRADIPDGLYVEGSHGALEQVLVNLLSNAADAMQGTGVIDVQARALADDVVIEVRDDGPGIPEAMLDELFTPFMSSKDHRGTGLGLAIVWSLVREHGGTVDGRNLPEGGACFRVTLPTPTLARTPPPAMTPDAPSRRRAQLRGDLLLLDDDPGVAAVLADVSRSIGYRVITVHTAQEALDLIQMRSFAGLVADVQLPGMSGRELLETLRLEHPELARRTVLMSGLFLEPEPGLRYLQKPFSRARLDATLREL